MDEKEFRYKDTRKMTDPTDYKKNPLPRIVDSQPRRIRLDYLQPMELAIYAAQQAIEEGPPSPHLTNAGILLQQAREKVADFYEGLPDQPEATANLDQAQSSPFGEAYFLRMESHGVSDLGLSPTEAIHALCDKLDEYAARLGMCDFRELAKVQPLCDFEARGKALGVDIAPSDDLLVACFKAFDRLEHAQPKAEVAEKVLFQTLVHSHGQDDNTMTRLGGVTKDIEAADGQAIKAIQAHTVKEVFVVRVHSAYTKELNIKKAI